MNRIEGVPPLSPVMSNRKLQVLDFIRLFHARHGVGPSLGEIAAAVGTTRTRVHDSIRKLAREGRVHHMPGQTRGVRPAETRDEALRVLREEGWVILPDRNAASHPNALPLLDVIEEEEPVTNSGLPPTCSPGHERHGKVGGRGKKGEEAGRAAGGGDADA